MGYYTYIVQYRLHTYRAMIAELDRQPPGKTQNKQTPLITNPTVKGPSSVMDVVVLAFFAR